MFSAEYGRDLDVRTAMVKSRIGDRLVSAFGDVNGVCGVYMVPSGDAVHVCTIIDEDDEQTYEVIYERERSIIRQQSDWDTNILDYSTDLGYDLTEELLALRSWLRP